MRRLLIAVASTLVLFTAAAEARITCDRFGCQPVTSRHMQPSHIAGPGKMVRILPHPKGCPRRAFCGCGVSVKVFGKPVRSLYLASNWSRFPRARPAPGRVAVRRGHVFLIEQVYGDGTVLAYDPNSGKGLTRRHRRSLSGFRVVDPSVVAMR